ncbi:2Fe-2S iron-sulfur cluster-binding protein [Hirschia maritima]|uniref:2Fe-2S iron-sulfur cluster-binding protein n=1 Tax=Hirschia maritima TaxID=1121961 RepID=UPI000361C1EE|nr:pyridoxamine 5'-phosphate oxidase family protein [Hirschia maritima]
MTDKIETKRSVLHEGEKALHDHLGITQQMEDVGGRMIRSFMPDQHRDFFQNLPFIVAGSVDNQGDAWATLLTGRPGFMNSPNNQQLDITANLAKSDPAITGLQNGDAVGLLGIELHTRRRNRMNGIIGQASKNKLSVHVGHSFGNCPQYIQLRDYNFVSDPEIYTTRTVKAYDAITPEIRKLITSADTFFVASYVDLENERQVDVSHRGGKPGFVHIDETGKFTIPDFAGNLIFNTLGNFLKNPKAGLIFPDFETGDVLQMTGDTEVILDAPEIDAYEGAERLWTFMPRKIILRKNALPLRWDFKTYSPNSLMAGSWDEAHQRLDAQRKSLEWRDFQITKIVNESSVIKSFWLEPIDGNGIVRHKAGQHLPIQINLPGKVQPELRTYTLSTAPSDSTYRISVKRDGIVSQYLHDSLQTGDVIKARAPQGGFVIDAKEKRPVVMLAAGVGITPFISMLRHLTYEGKRTRGHRPAWLFQAARKFEERAFDNEIEDMLAAAEGQFRLVRTLSETDDPQNGKKGIEARLSTDLLKAVLPFDDYDFYLCGPTSFMTSLYEELRDMNISDNRIFFEAFGPSSITRRPDNPKETPPKSSTTSVGVTFSKSKKSAVWKPESGTLLELAEENGLSPNHSCRMGSCGACKVKLLDGRVVYNSPPTHPVGEDEVLICCAEPAEDKRQTPLSLEL